MRCRGTNVLVWAAVVAANLTPWTTAAAQVHQLRILSRDCGASGCRVATGYGSAVAIGRHNPGKELFLTAGHCMRGPVERVEVGIGRQWHRAVVLGSTMADGQDLAVVGVTYDGDPLRCAPIAATDPQPNDAATITGYPRGTSYRSRTGRVLSHRYRLVDLVVSLPTIPGESGGGIFDDAGRLVGIVSATAPPQQPTHTLATGVERIRAFLQQTINGVPHCAAAVPSSSEPDRPSRQDSELRAEIERLKTRLAALEARRPAPGPPGPKGDPGPPGPPAILPADFIPRLERLEQTRIPVQILAPDGRVLDEQRYQLGEPIQLRLAPRAP